jgi:integrase
VDGDRIYGPGTNDIKGGSVMMWLMLTALRAHDPKLFEDITWKLFWNSSEECYSPDFSDLCRARFDRGTLGALIFESEGRSGQQPLMVVARKGQGTWRVTASGRASHAGGKHERGGRGARLLKGRVVRLMDDCGWKVPIQITPDSFMAWRSGRAESARTLNHYLQGMVAFLNWMECSGRLKSNPLKHVRKVDERGQRRRFRRAFTDEELRKLVEGSGPRGIIYLTAARTGLRQEELRQLTWVDVNLEGNPPYVVVRETCAKNKTEERVCLVPEIVEALKAHRPASAQSGALVFPTGIPRASRLKVDAERNLIQYRDESGRCADFHALRYTWATFLQRNDVPQRFAMKLMRHSYIKLTAKVYTDETQLPIYEAIKGLPRLLDHTQIRAQISGAAGQNVAQRVASSEGNGHAETPVNGGVCRMLALAGAAGGLERAKGFEPSTLTLAT